MLGDADDENGSDVDETLEGGNEAHDISLLLQAGKRHVLERSLWLLNDKTAFLITENPQYNATQRYANNEQKMQGQLRDLKQLFPKKFEDDFHKPAFYSHVCIIF